MLAVAPECRAVAASPLPPALAAWLAERLGAVPLDLEPVGGGCIHRSARLQLADGRRCFLKRNGPALLPVLQAEAEGLAALAAAAERLAAAAGRPGPVVPRPLGCDLVGGEAVLLLPWLPLAAGRPARAQQGWERLGRDLARLHRASRELNRGRGFGWEGDNFIGTAPQRNGWCADWGQFFAERRLRPQLESGRRRGQPWRGAEELLERVPAWLAGHGAEPVLVHGDLWSGNAGLLEEGDPSAEQGGDRRGALRGDLGGHLPGGVGALFDPAVSWSDREVDLAMARLFGGFPAAFFAGYQHEWPLAPGTEGRVEIYNLYHLLNHANLFGGGYGGQAQAVIDRLLAQPPA